MALRTSRYQLQRDRTANVSAIKSIIAGEQTSTVFKDIKELASAATNIIDAMVNGREVVIPGGESWGHTTITLLMFQHTKLNQRFLIRVTGMNS